MAISVALADGADGERHPHESPIAASTATGITRFTRRSVRPNSPASPAASCHASHLSVSFGMAVHRTAESSEDTGRLGMAQVAVWGGVWYFTSGVGPNTSRDRATIPLRNLPGRAHVVHSTRRARNGHSVTDNAAIGKESLR